MFHVKHAAVLISCRPLAQISRMPFLRPKDETIFRCRRKQQSAFAQREKGEQIHVRHQIYP